MSSNEEVYCPTCDSNKVKIVNEDNLTQCSSCGNVNVYDSRGSYERQTGQL
jgi:uncharacterized Zn finger protein